jgi:cell wall-associated NlpC family hydrolase
LKPLRAFALCVTTSLVLVLPAAASAQAPGADKSGGAAYQAPTPTPTPPPAPPAPQDLTVPGAVAQLLPDGTAAAPADAPPQVQQAIWAANKIQSMPYVYGGGHGDFEDDGYDCSGTVSYALHGAGLLDSPLDSGSFMSWGESGAGQWITVYTNPGHAYAVIAGLRLDTSAAGDPSGAKGPRWRPVLRSSHGFRARHPVGL